MSQWVGFQLARDILSLIPVMPLLCLLKTIKASQTALRLYNTTGFSYFAMCIIFTPKGPIETMPQ